MPTQTKYEIGCYADGMFGNDHLEDTIHQMVSPLTDRNIEAMDIDDVVELLNDITTDERPEYSYWGFHNGDFGLWPDLYGAEVADNLPRVEEIPDFLLHVNDHGNVTLYRVTVTEEWGIV